MQGAVATPVLRRQRQPGQRLYRPVCAQHRVRQLEDLVPAGGQAGMELPAEPRQRGERPDISSMV